MNQLVQTYDCKEPMRLFLCPKSGSDPAGHGICQEVSDECYSDEWEAPPEEARGVSADVTEQSIPPLALVLRLPIRLKQKVCDVVDGKKTQRNSHMVSKKC